jgi:hypothetical protein
MTVQRTSRPSRLVPLARTDDEACARAWLAARDAAEVAAELRIEDARKLGSSSMLPLGPVFATTLYVSGEQRTRAAAVLIDLGWDGRHISSGLRRTPFPLGAFLGGGIAAVIATLAVIVAVLLRGG